MIFGKKIPTPTISNNAKKTPSSTSKLSPFSYDEANYFNFYRILENQNRDEQKFRERTCLINNKNLLDCSFNLESFTIESELNDSSIIQCWTQEYSNNSKVPVEAKYQLPLSPSSVISRFVVEYKDQILEAKIKETSKAKEKYNDAIASGGQAFLGEKTDNGLFNFMIGNIPPQEKVIIRLTIVSEIGTHLSSLHYCLHRYMFPKNQFKFKYNLNINLSTPINNIHLDHYQPTIEYKSKDKKSAKLKFQSTKGISNNIITIIVPETSDKPQSFIEYSEQDKSYAVALNFYPEFNQVKLEDINQKSEYIFVVDCSGSMSGEPIKKAKRALDLCIRSLNFECSKFNIYCFGSTFTKCFEQSEIYGDASLARASQYVDLIDARLGGTSLLPPIKDILTKPYDPEYPRQVFIITDGAVSSRDQLIDYVAKESNTTRMFTYGIGNSVDKELVIGLSNACKGYYEFINDNKEMEEKVMKLLKIANEPTLSNISIDWNGLQVTQAPSTIRPIFNRERMMIYGTINSLIPETNTPITVKMIGNGPTGDILEFLIELDFKKDSVDKSSNKIHTLSAFKQIQDLEEQERKQSNESNKDKIIQLGKKFNLASKHTSFIVTVDGDGEVIEESMKSIDILVQPHQSILNTNTPVFRRKSDTSSVMERSRSISPSDSQSCTKSKKMCAAPRSKSSFLSSPPPSPLSVTSCSLSSPSSSSSSSLYSSSPIPTASNDPLINLVRSQRANGSWSKSSMKLFIVDQSKIPTELSQPEHEDIWTTLLVIAKFRKDFSKEIQQWESIVIKSIKWVKQQLKTLNLLDQFDKFESLSKTII